MPLAGNADLPLLVKFDAEDFIALMKAYFVKTDASFYNFNII